MKHIRNFGNGALLGSMSMVMMGALAGCSGAKDESINENKFIILKELPTGKYQVVSEEPTGGPTQVVVEQADGTLKKLSQEEIKAIAQAEYEKVQAGTSEATQSNNSGGMGLGSTILAVAAGSILGNMIANQLMGNRNFQRNNQAASSRARAFKRQQAAKRSSSKKGFFGKSGTSSKRSGGFFGG
jgi:hypothetical protein